MLLKGLGSPWRSRTRPEESLRKEHTYTFMYMHGGPHIYVSDTMQGAPVYMYVGERGRREDSTQLSV